MKINVINKSRLCELRKNRGYSIKDVSIMLGITEKGMVDIEEKPSEVSIQLAAKLARFYNMPTSMITWN